MKYRNVVFTLPIITKEYEIEIMLIMKNFIAVFDYFHAATVVLGSTAGAAEWMGEYLGEFVEQKGEHNGRVFYKQRETEAEEGAYIYFEENVWWVGQGLGKAKYLRNTQVTKLPPKSGWEYGSNDDSTLALEFASLPSPCQLVEVDGDSEVRKHQASKLGNYRIQQNRWSRGRPVYQLNSELEVWYLLVKNYKTIWSISSSTTSTDEWSTDDWIYSGRGTNSPTDVEAAGNVAHGQTRWSYWDGNAWKEGNITVKCLD